MDFTKNHKLLYLIAYNKQYSMIINSGDIVNYQEQMINYINQLDLTIDNEKIYKLTNTDIPIYLSYQIKNQIIYLILYQSTRHNFILNCIRRIIQDFHNSMCNANININWLKSEFDMIFTYYNNINNDKLNKLYDEVTKAEEIMKNNIELALSRGDNFDNLLSKTDDLEKKAILFNNNADNIKKKMCIDNLKASGCIIIIICCIIIFIVGVGWVIYKVIA